MDDRILVIERSFRASPAEVYAVWTDPAALPRWFGPAGYTCETHVMDLCVGGEWRFTMHGEGQAWPNRHRWTALVPPGDGSGDGSGRIEFLLDAATGDEPKAVTVHLVPEGTGTRLRQVMQFPTPEEVVLARSYDAPAKGQETLTKLAAHLGE